MKKIICAIITFSMLVNTCVFTIGETGGTNGGSGASGVQATNGGPNASSQKAVVLFAHGYGGTGSSCSRYYAQPDILPDFQVVSFEFPDSIKNKENNGKLNKKKTCFGQEQETETLKNNFEAQKAAGNKVLAVGISRGAMCVLSANIPGAIGIFAESPGASLIDIVDHQCKKYGFGWMPFLSDFIHDWILRPFVYNNYDPNGQKPIDMVKNIPLDTPVFISYTINDTLIPASSSVKLAEELVKTGHTAVYIYGSNLGYHAHILYLDENYKKVFKEFLVKCGVIDCSNSCADGQKLLEDCKIKSLEQVQSLRSELELANWTAYWGRNIVGFLVSSVIIGQAAKKLLNYVKNGRKTSYLISKF